jgi:hypothetical protein
MCTLISKVYLLLVVSSNFIELFGKNVPFYFVILLAANVSNLAYHKTHTKNNK